MIKLVVFPAAFAMILPADVAIRVPFVEIAPALAIYRAVFVGVFARLMIVAA